MDIRYFGWSGVTIRHSNVLIGIDLFGDAVTWDALGEAETRIFCLTHGHPEHCGSLRNFLAQPQARPYLPTTHVISSQPVINYIAQGSRLAPENLHSISAGEYLSFGEAQVTPFVWKHMPLLPPGVRPKIEYFVSLLSHPVDLLRIGLSTLSLPANAPMLGFHVQFSDGFTLLDYAEGLHRLTDPREVEAIARELPAQVLLFAVEPDDIDDIPRWIKALHPKTVYLYEAHRPWRELFGLPYVDLNDYAQDLSARFGKTHFNTLSLCQ